MNYKLLFFLSLFVVFGVFAAKVQSSSSFPDLVKFAPLSKIFAINNKDENSPSKEQKTLDPGKEYYFEGCVTKSSPSSSPFSLLVIQQPRSGKISDKRVITCLEEVDHNNKNNICPPDFGQNENLIVSNCKLLYNDDEEDSSISYELHIGAKQDSNLFQRNNNRKAQSQSTSSSSSSPTDVPNPQYVSYETMIKRLKTLELNYPTLVQTFHLQNPTTGQDYKTWSDSNLIWGAKLSSSISSYSPNKNYTRLKLNAKTSSLEFIENDPTKHEIVIIGAMHAREWIAAEVSMGLLEALVNLYHVNKNSQKLIDTFEWIFIPVMNPDGYEWSRNKDRLWRKNRRRLDEKDARYHGVDLNRNFPYHWGDNSGSSPVYYSLTYRGPWAGSETETQAVMHGLFRQRKLVSTRPAFVFSVHSYGGAFLIPPGFQNNVYTQTFSIIQKMLEDGVTAVSSTIPNTPASSKSTLATLRQDYYHSAFTVEPAWQLYPVSGDMIDWVHYEFGQMPCSTIELRPTGSEGCCEFQLGAGDIPPSLLEQLGILINTADTIRFVTSHPEKYFNMSSYDPSTMYWWRHNQSNINSVKDMPQILLDRRSTQDWNNGEIWPTLESFFEASSTSSPSTETNPTSETQFDIAKFLEYQNPLREKVFEIQQQKYDFPTSPSRFSPWISVFEKNSTYSKTIYDFENEVSSSSAKWITISLSSGEFLRRDTMTYNNNEENVFEKARTLAEQEQSSSSPTSTSNFFTTLRNANSTMRNLWKQNSPSVIDYSSNFISFDSTTTLPIHVLVQESSDNATSLCKMIETLKNRDQDGGTTSSSPPLSEDYTLLQQISSTLLNNTRMGYKYQQPNSCPSDSNVVEDVSLNRTLYDLVMMNSSSHFDFEVSISPESYSRRSFSSSSTTESTSTSGLCSFQIRFKVNSTASALIENIGGGTTSENYFASSNIISSLDTIFVEFSSLAITSMDPSIWKDLSCNNVDQKYSSSSNDDTFTNAIVGVQVKLTDYDEDIIANRYSSTSSAFSPPGHPVSSSSLLIFFDISILLIVTASILIVFF